VVAENSREEKTKNISGVIIEASRLCKRKDNAILITEQKEAQLIKQIELTHQCIHLSVIRDDENRQVHSFFPIITPTDEKPTSSKIELI
jgi:hypothetical protein